MSMPMRPFELAYMAMEPFLPAFQQRVRRDLLSIVNAYALNGGPVRVLDVGARKSHYTIGLRARLLLMDVERESEIQQQLNLGSTNGIREQLRKRRSNVEDYVVEDLLMTELPAGSFDVISAIEVIEHVREDERFVEQVARLLKPGGTFYCTTPNGIAIRNHNPDHVRHYTKRELEQLLSRNFDEVQVRFEIRTSAQWQASQLSWTPRRPFRTFRSMVGGFVNRFEQVETAAGAAHLFGTAVRRA